MARYGAYCASEDIVIAEYDDSERADAVAKQHAVRHGHETWLVHATIRQLGRYKGTHVFLNNRAPEDVTDTLWSTG